jgi:hypothetical protein
VSNNYFERRKNKIEEMMNGVKNTKKKPLKKPIF